MKRAWCIFLVLTLCLSMAACSFLPKPVVQQEEPTIPTIAPDKEPDIILNENDVTLEERPGGSYRCTKGTNCGTEGIMLIEVLDANGVVHNTFSPKMAGSKLSLHQDTRPYTVFFNTAKQREIEIAYTTIYESSAAGTGNGTFNQYILYPRSDGVVYSYEEMRDFKTVRCDLYKPNGQLIVSLTPSDPNHEVHLAYSNNGVNVFHVPGVVDYFDVTEAYFIYPDGKYYFHPFSRQTIYSTSGELLLDNWMTMEEHKVFGTVCAQVELRDANGEVKKTYSKTDDIDHWFVFYNNESNVIDISGGSGKYQECLTPVTYETIYREQQFFQDGAYSHTEIEYVGGQVVITESHVEECFAKLEFYDDAGVLRKTVAPPEGGFLSVHWSMATKTFEIRIFDANYEEIKWDTYTP